jgi:hypothetical protein
MDMNNGEWVADAKLQTEDGGTWLLKYFLHIYESESQTPLYGLRVEKYDPQGTAVETQATPALTDCRAESLRLAHRFAKGCVPPCTLLEMADEWAFDCVSL